MQTSPTLDKLSPALAQALGAMKNPTKSRNVTVRTKDKQGNYNGEYTFAYATLDQILDIARPALSAAGVALVQAVGTNADGKVVLSTRLMCQGEWIESSLPVLPERDGMQALGSAITYVRRYAITAMLGLASEEDDDANGQAGNEVQPAQRQQQARGGNQGQGKAAPASNQGTGSPTTARPTATQSTTPAKTNTPASPTPAAAGTTTDRPLQDVTDIAAQMAAEDERLRGDVATVKRLIGEPAYARVWKAFAAKNMRAARLLRFSVLAKSLETIVRVVGADKGAEQISEQVDAFGGDAMGPQAVRMMIDAFASNAEGMPYDIPTPDAMREIEERALRVADDGAAKGKA